MSRPSLSVVVVTLNAQNRLSSLLEALAKQSIIGELEILILAMDSSASRIEIPAGLKTVLVQGHDFSHMGQARAEAVRRARATLVAFLEDHTVPEPLWAEKVRDSFYVSPEINAVAYAFLNGSPDTYFYRSVFMAEYGALSHPLKAGKAAGLASNNVAYRRDALTAFGSSLDGLIEVDFFLQKAMGSGFKIAAAPMAIVRHQTNRRFKDLLKGHFFHSQLFAQRRLKFEPMGPVKRWAAAIAVSAIVPLLRIKRLFQSLAPGPNVSRAVAALPVILILYCAGALGESWGLFFRVAESSRRLIWLELESERIAG